MKHHGGISLTQQIINEMDAAETSSQTVKELEAERDELKEFIEKDDEDMQRMYALKSSKVNTLQTELTTLKQELKASHEKAEKILKALRQKEHDAVAISGLGMHYLVLSKLEDF